MNDGVGFGERIFLKKKRTRRFVVNIEGSLVLEKYDADSKKLKEIIRRRNTLNGAGVDEMLELLIGASSKHLSLADANLLLGNADPIPTSAFTMNPADAFETPTPTKSAPSYALAWRFEDNTTTARSNLNHAELWYEDPDGISGPVKFNHINGAWGSKPTNEFWHWKPTFEFYSTDTDFQSFGLQKLLELIAGVGSLHLDATHVWFRPFTSADAGLGSTGQLPDAAPTTTPASDKITAVFTVADGVFNGAWDKSEIKIAGATYAAASRLRYGGCKQDGTGCGTKATGESWEYTYEIVLAQGS